MSHSISWTPFWPPYPPLSHWLWEPASCIELALAIYFTYGFNRISTHKSFLMHLKLEPSFCWVPIPLLLLHGTMQFANSLFWWYLVWFPESPSTAQAPACRDGASLRTAEPHPPGTTAGAHELSLNGCWTQASILAWVLHFLYTLTCSWTTRKFNFLKQYHFYRRTIWAICILWLKQR